MTSISRISMLVAAGAIRATLGVGTCSTNARFNDVNSRFDDANALFDGVNRRTDDVQADIRALRSLVIDAIRRRTPAAADADAAAT